MYMGHMIQWEEKMNNNFYEIPTDWYNEFNNTFMNSMNNMPNMNGLNMDNNIADAKTGFLRGNMFSNLYDPYKNYKYRELKPTNKKEELLYNILKNKFAMIDLGLYLDMYPDDKNVINLYSRYLADEKRLCEEYERSYGPLTMDDVMNMNEWKWIASPWPWEGTK